MLPAMKAHGMPWFSAYLRGEIDLDRAAELARRDTRRYAKRQFTWINNQLAAWPRIEAPDLATRSNAAMAVLRAAP